jgi:hypothetical protein
VFAGEHVNTVTVIVYGGGAGIWRVLCLKTVPVNIPRKGVFVDEFNKRSLEDIVFVIAVVLHPIHGTFEEGTVIVLTSPIDLGQSGFEQTGYVKAGLRGAIRHVRAALVLSGGRPREGSSFWPCPSY